MKIIPLLMVICSCLSSRLAFSQSDSRLSPYLLPAFEDGVLYYASAPPRNAKFNYHLVGQEIVMDFNNTKVPVNNFPNLDSVRIGDRIFIIIEGKSYQQLIKGPVQLLMDYKYTSQMEANEGAYGTKSHSAGVVVADQHIRPNDFYALHWNDGYELINRNEAFIVQDGEWSKFGNANQLGQIFKDKKKEIKDFSSINKTEFGNPGDVKKIIEFLLVGKSN